MMDPRRQATVFGFWLLACSVVPTPCDLRRLRRLLHSFTSPEYEEVYIASLLGLVWLEVRGRIHLVFVLGWGSMDAMRSLLQTTHADLSNRHELHLHLPWTLYPLKAESVWTSPMAMSLCVGSGKGQRPTRTASITMSRQVCTTHDHEMYGQAWGLQGKESLKRISCWMERRAGEIHPS